MFFRFGSAIVMVVLVSLAGIALEKQNLTYRRQLSRQHFQMDVLLEEHSRIRLRTQQMGAPIRVIDALEQGDLQLQQPDQSARSSSHQMPLLRWQRATPYSK